MTSSGNSQSGFTLIEAVITMTLATILGAMMYSYFSEALMRSAEPVHNLQKAFDLHAAMENITADYYDIVSASVVPNTWEPSTGYLPGDQVVSKSQKFGHIYTCITGGTSGATENWSTDTGMTITDGDIEWKVEPGQLDALFARLDNANDLTDYGNFLVKERKFIRFESGIEQEVTDPAQPRNLLRVTIRDVLDGNLTLTALFTTTY